MRIYLQSIDFDVWNYLVVKYIKPQTPISLQTEEQKKQGSFNSETMNALFWSLDKTEFHKVSTYTTAYEIQHKFKSYT